MKRTIFAGVAADALGVLLAYPNPAAPLDREPIAIERASMDGWLKGDSPPMLSAADPDITLFHVMTLHRADGLEAVKSHDTPYAGRPLVDRCKKAAGLDDHHSLPLLRQLGVHAMMPPLPAQNLAAQPRLLHPKNWVLSPNNSGAHLYAVTRKSA